MLFPLFNVPNQRILQPNEGTRITNRSQKIIKEFGLKIIRERKEEHRIGKLDRVDIISLLSEELFK